MLPEVSRIKNVNPQFRRIVKNSGITPWPDLCYNLRQSAINDAEHNPRFTSKNVSDWFGNSEQTRQKHYSRTLIEDVEAATAGDGRDLAWMDKTDSVQILSMKASETGRNGRTADKKTPENSNDFSGVRSRSQGISGPNWT